MTCKKGSKMFEEKYFTEKDAMAVFNAFQTFYPDIHFKVQYQGIYGELGKEWKTAYWVKFSIYNRTYYINTVRGIKMAIRDIYKAQEYDTVNNVNSLIVGLVKGLETDETG